MSGWIMWVVIRLFEHAGVRREGVRSISVPHDVTDAAGAQEAGEGVWQTLVLPTCDALLSPILYALPAQLLAYHTAVAKGTDVDQPRNLAKSVTVE